MPMFGLSKWKHRIHLTGALLFKAFSSDGGHCARAVNLVLGISHAEQSCCNLEGVHLDSTFSSVQLLWFFSELYYLIISNPSESDPFISQADRIDTRWIRYRICKLTFCVITWCNCVVTALGAWCLFCKWFTLPYYYLITMVLIKMCGCELIWWKWKRDTRHILRMIANLWIDACKQFSTWIDLLSIK